MVVMQVYVPRFLIKVSNKKTIKILNGMSS